MLVEEFKQRLEIVEAKVMLLGTSISKTLDGMEKPDTTLLIIMEALFQIDDDLETVIGKLGAKIP